MLDQLKLPGEVVHHTYTDYREVSKAITHTAIFFGGKNVIADGEIVGVAIDELEGEHFLNPRSYPGCHSSTA